MVASVCHRVTPDSSTTSLSLVRDSFWRKIMLDQGMFRNHFVGRDGFVWWIGQIADENTWKANIPGFPAPTNESTEGESIGFGERYKVRIMGYHTAAPSEL